MTETSLAARLRDGNRLVGLITKMPAPAHVELAGHLNFDLVIVDTEHGIAGASELDHHLRAADATGIPALVRLPALDRGAAQHALDGGAAGVIIPGVDSVETAQEAVRLAHYPPFGTRGLATSTRAGHQTTLTTATHLDNARTNTMVVLQLESKRAAENARKILAVEGVSAVWIGLSDLSVELGKFGQFDDPEVAAAIASIVDATRDAELPLFVIADNETDAQQWGSDGAQVLLINLLTIAARGLGNLRTSHANLLHGANS
jgi:4-hydroxy-2-oxoheptanedioate aldolase